MPLFLSVCFCQSLWLHYHQFASMWSPPFALHFPRDKICRQSNCSYFIANNTALHEVDFYTIVHSYTIMHALKWKEWNRVYISFFLMPFYNAFVSCFLKSSLILIQCFDLYAFYCFIISSTPSPLIEGP